MIFTDKYISTAEAAIDTKTTKQVIGNDAFAIGEAIQELIKKIEQVRLSFIK